MLHENTNRHKLTTFSISQRERKLVRRKCDNFGRLRFIVLLHEQGASIWRMRATLHCLIGEFKKIRAHKATFINSIFIQSKTLWWVHETIQPWLSDMLHRFGKFLIQLFLPTIITNHVLFQTVKGSFVRQWLRHDFFRGLIAFRIKNKIREGFVFAKTYRDFHSLLQVLKPFYSFNVRRFRC